MVKNPPAKQEMQVLSLGGEDRLEKEMATHSSILVWRISLVGYHPWDHKESYMTTGKTRAFNGWTFVGKVMSLLFNMLSRLIITFLPSSNHHLISWLQSPYAVIFGAQKNKIIHCFHYFPICLP